jgi:hypothetical protein
MGFVPQRRSLNPHLQVEGIPRGGPRRFGSGRFARRARTPVRAGPGAQQCGGDGDAMGKPWKTIGKW